MLDNLEINAIPDSVDNAIKNLTDEPTRTAAHTLSDIWYLVFGGISHIADKRRMRYAHNLDCLRHELANKINKIPADKQIEPNIQVTAQALEDSKYCVESKQLREMFSNLIANSMNADYAMVAHPAYAGVIKQMSPTDARVLKAIPPKYLIPIVDYVIEDKRSGFTETQYSNIYIPFLPGLDILKQATSISSLSRLGILNIDTELKITDESAYEPYEHEPVFKEFSQKIYRYNPSKVATLRKYCGRLTPFGENFVQVCL